MSILKKVVVCGGVMLALAACEHGDPVSTAGGKLGHAVLMSGTPSASKLPGGSAVVTTVFGGFTSGVPDALNRKPANATVARRTRFFAAASAGLWFEFPYDISRNGNPATLDPRIPVPQSQTATIRPATAVMELYQPASPYPGDEYWELYTRFSGLDPATTYNLAFVHRRLSVAGEVDHVDVITTGSVNGKPDTLRLLAGGTPAEINTNWTGAAPAGCAPFPGPNTNPFTVATFTTTTGTAGAVSGPTLDKCWQSGNGIWTKAEFDEQAKSMVGRSDDVGYSLPNYNYVELWQGAVEAGTLVVRVQIAQDLAPNGAPVPNAYPPFPAPNTVLWTGHPDLYDANYGDTPPPVVDQSPSFPIDAALTATLPGAVGVPTGVALTLRNVQKLGTPVYKAWFINATTGAAKVAPGHYVRFYAGTNVEDVASTSTFKGGPGTITFTATYDPSPAVHGPYTDSLTFLVITREDDAAATTPSMSQPLWVKTFKIPPNSAGGTVAFGNFNRDSLSASGDTSRHPVLFVPQGVASGGVIGDTASVLVPQTGGAAIRKSVFFGSTLEMRFSNLQRPPKGYEYLAYMRLKRVVNGTTVVSDSGLQVLGPITGPAGESLANADAGPRSNLLGPQGISSALFRYDAAGIPNGLCNFDQFRLYLTPKGGVTTEPATLIFDIPLPDRVTLAYQCQ